MNEISSEATKQADLHTALVNGDNTLARGIIAALHVAEIADIIENTPSPERHQVWRLIATDREGAVLAELRDPVRAELLGQMPLDLVANVTKDLATDDAADILQDLPDNLTDTILQGMDKQNRERLQHILTYAEDTAGGLMDIDIISVRADVTLDVVMRYLRRLGQIPEKTDNLMVVDRKNRYLGVLPLTELLLKPQDTTVAEWVKPTPSLVVSKPRADVARLFEHRHLFSAAVIDEAGVLLGRITVDDVVDVIQEQADKTVRSMAGLGDEDLFSPVPNSIKRRALWLGINLVTAFLVAWVIGWFEESIAQLVTLAILMPIVAGMGGIAGSQTLTIAIRALALGQLGKQNISALIIKEMTIGLFNGMLWALVVAAIVIVWFNDPGLGIIIGLAMIINLIMAAFAGAAIPIVLKHYGIDPAIAGGVILTTVTDIVGFITFLGLATVMLLR